MLQRLSWAYQSLVISTGLPFLGDDVEDDPGLHPVGDGLGLVGDRDYNPLLRCVGVGFAVDPLAARTHRPVGVVDLRREVGRVEIDRFAALGQAPVGVAGGRRGIGVGGTAAAGDERESGERSGERCYELVIGHDTVLRGSAELPLRFR